MRLKNWFYFLLFFLSLLLSLFPVPNVTLAQLGAGVGLGTISIDQVLTPGGIYKLPLLPVINTGQITASYKLQALPSVFEKGLLVPKSSWFNFSPNRFTLRKGQSKTVSITLGLPFDAPAGKYTALLEASATGQGTQGQVQIGSAAAARVYFEVGQAPGVLGAFRQRLNSYWTLYQPWTYLVFMAVDLLLIVLLINSIVQFSFRFKVERKRKRSRSDS